MSLPPAKAVPLIPPFLPAPHAAAACIAVPPRRLRIFPLTGKLKPPRSLPDFADAQSTEQSRRGPRNPHREYVCDSGMFSQLFLKSGFRRAGRAKRMGESTGKIGRLFFSWKNLAHSRGRPRRHLCRLPSSERERRRRSRDRARGGRVQKHDTRAAGKGGRRR